ncbi:hypothetical protein GUITHDRAFT_139673 [Guillardia theta CCMP2712]|uniref:Uncharacterized protein n=1 Tax=Guillardia theta (strain CCMP2712) TaxID=905079 RepID=L1J7A7_GUITC|nr:hypothetical protein GUITHDRAFT_139673 [Guillardia theta CCMP2712]EKX44418.1 hypothetical protein GUITHDRAFT_139673 [Guillardia theta CCMP2712]|eukprot:XP_005831398.1 hypothetical protein GUITHDRAFT_139673 [Guillardia theta CCMP2712]
MARLLEDYKIMRSLQMGGLSHPSKPKSCEDLKERIETQTVQESNKRRKVSRTTVDVQPVQQTTTEDVAVSHEKPKQITETDFHLKLGVDWLDQILAKENTEQADSAAIPNLYSDISESFLSDPQISSLLQDANSIEDIFGESNLSWLVEPLTNHINAKLNESNSTDCSNTGKAQASNDTERRKQGERRSVKLSWSFPHFRRCQHKHLREMAWQHGTKMTRKFVMRRARESEASRGDEKKFTNSSHHDALWRMFDENFLSGSIAIEVKEATLEDVEAIAHLRCKSFGRDSMAYHNLPVSAKSKNYIDRLREWIGGSYKTRYRVAAARCRSVELERLATEMMQSDLNESFQLGG